MYLDCSWIVPRRAARSGAIQAILAQVGQISACSEVNRTICQHSVKAALRSSAHVQSTLTRKGTCYFLLLPLLQYHFSLPLTDVHLPQLRYNIRTTISMKVCFSNWALSIILSLICKMMVICTDWVKSFFPSIFLNKASKYNIRKDFINFKLNSSSKI